MAEYYYYTVKTNERWDNISAMAYGVANKAHLIIVANPNIPLSPLAPEGMEIKIPILETVDVSISSENLPLWKQ